MQQRTRRFAILFGGAFVATLGAIAACSTDNGTTPLPTGNAGNDSGRDSARADGSGNDDEKDDSGTPSGGDGGADCGNLPKPRPGIGPYCLGVDAGKGVNCDSEKNEVCCSDGKLEGSDEFAASECKAATKSASGGYNVGGCDSTYQGDGGKEYHCTGPDHCPGEGEYCCAVPNVGVTTLAPGTNNKFPTCKAYYQNGRFTAGTRCKADGCAPGDLTLCAKDEDCKAGTCVPLSLEGRDVGYCRVQ